MRVNWRRPVPHSGIEARGPYEPLVLSAPGDYPLVQVIVFYQDMAVPVGYIGLLSVLCFSSQI